MNETAVEDELFELLDDEDDELEFPRDEDDEVRDCAVEEDEDDDSELALDKLSAEPLDEDATTSAPQYVNPGPDCD